MFGINLEKSIHSFLLKTDDQIYKHPLLKFLAQEAVFSQSLSFGEATRVEQAWKQKTCWDTALMCRFDLDRRYAARHSWSGCHWNPVSRIHARSSPISVLPLQRTWKGNAGFNLHVQISFYLRIYLFSNAQPTSHNLSSFCLLSFF